MNGCEDTDKTFLSVIAYLQMFYLKIKLFRSTFIAYNFYYLYTRYTSPKLPLPKSPTNKNCCGPIRSSSLDFDYFKESIVDEVFIKI